MKTKNYSVANTRIMEIVNMDAAMFEFLLNRKNSTPEIINNAIKFAEIYATSDSRNNFALNGNIANNIIANHSNLDTLTLKIIELSITFGDSKYFNLISDQNSEVIATTFKTNTEHVKAYRLLNTRLKEIEEKTTQRVR